jgi:aspartate oxidase
VDVENLDYVQIHPTTLYTKNPGRRFLISESVRGEGAVLLDKYGNRFTDELQPRDVVTAAIREQMRKDGTDYVLEDMRPLGKQTILHHFPNIYERCKQEGYDVLHDPIPVVPAQHYHMGGVKVDLNSESSMKGLYVVGEASCNGVHGRNRLASNSLLECVVCAYEVAEFLKSKNLSVQTKNFEKISEKYEYPPEKYNDVENLKDELKNIMWQNVGIFRNKTTLEDALKKIKNLQSKFNRKDVCATASEYELRNMLLTAELVVYSALNRNESRGAHYRTDYLDTSDVCEHSIINNQILKENNFVS